LVKLTVDFSKEQNTCHDQLFLLQAGFSSLKLDSQPYNNMEGVQKRQTI